ncbi:Nin one binding Zn-ribbon like-domain-containing protein [Pelagophyceae sp. CCMP2097]|nr:Nin one binding Zn-ribbon like-domain-containing protein [Pelagophyceae sp. CCMP2097]
MAAEGAADAPVAAPAVIDEAAEAEARQTMEYYFSDSNYHRDTHLKGLEDEFGWVDLEELALYPKLLKLLDADLEALARAVSTSKTVSLDESRTKVRRAPKKREQATHLVLDANALIRGRATTLASIAREFVTVPEVLAEIRDPQSRAALNALPFELKTREPSDAAMQFVVDFARKTGDLRALSIVDLKVLALTYMVEVEEAGESGHLRTAPDSFGPVARATAPKPRPTTDTRRRAVPLPEGPRAPLPEAGPPLPPAVSWADAAKRAPRPQPAPEAAPEAEETEHSEFFNHAEILEEEGEDEEEDDEATVEPGEAIPAFPGGEEDGFEGEEGEFDDSGDSKNGDSNEEPDAAASKPYVSTSSRILSSGGGGVAVGTAEDDDGVGWLGGDNFESARASGSLFTPLDNGDAEAAIVVVQGASCATADFAMQNVLLQIGLRLVSLDGMVVRRTKRWALRCDACFAVETDTLRLFCGRCGTAAMRRVSFGVDAATGKRQLFLRKVRKHDLRGTKFALPKPGTEKRFEGPLLLREDQLLQGIWRQKAARARASQAKTVGKSAFATEVSETLEAINVSRPPAELKVGFGGKNPNAMKGRERRGKKKRNH